MTATLNPYLSDNFCSCFKQRLTVDQLPVLGDYELNGMFITAVIPSFRH